MIIIINNSGKLKDAYSTPKLITFMKKNNIPYFVVSEITDLNKLLVYDRSKIKGIILSGSNLKYTEKLCTCKINMNLLCLLEFNVPILGICFGFQTIGISFGGKIKSLQHMRDKRACVKFQNHFLFKNVEKTHKFRSYHRDYLAEIPITFRPIAYGENNIIEAIEHYNKPIYGVQFHPELSGKEGSKLLINFLKKCKMT